jgi:hypothetical protein
MKFCLAKLAGSAILVSLLLHSALAQGGPNARFERQPLQTFVQDQQKLQSLLRGIYVMKSRNNAAKDSALYRTSWEYWANIHGYPGTGPRAGFGPGKQTVAEIRDSDRSSPLFVGFFTGLKDFTPPDALAAELWATCEHGTRYFLAWHRMYLYFFERVLRSASGDPNFALPYWDYTNITPAAKPEDVTWRLPSIFAVPRLSTGTSEIDNPVYELRRTSGFGVTVQLDTELTNPDSVLALSNFDEFQSTLDAGIHGNIHCSVGNTCEAPYIGHVPFSANDPIFWHHHANIDRLWECWIRRYGKDANPLKDTQWMGQTFAFVDENGNKATMKVEELFKPDGRIDYKYDNVDKCFRIEPPTVNRTLVSEAAPQANLVGTDVAMASNISVNKVDQRIALARSPAITPETADRALGFSVRPNVLAPTSAILRISDVRVDKNPGGSVKVYLTDASGQRKEFAGVMSFFDAFMSGHNHGNHARNFSFDVSTQLQRLLQDRSESDNISVALVPSNGVTGGTTIDPSQYESAGLHIGEIKLQVKTSTVPLQLPPLPNLQ